MLASLFWVHLNGDVLPHTFERTRLWSTHGSSGPGTKPAFCGASDPTESRDHDDGESSHYGWAMASPILLCTDGSDEALGALSAGLDLLGAEHEFVLVTVADAPDEESLVGSGHAGPELSLKEYDDQVAQASEAAKSAIRKAQSELALVGAEVHVLRGDPGAAICQLATELSARAVVIGSRGRGGTEARFSRLSLGSRRSQFAVQRGRDQNLTTQLVHTGDVGPEESRGLARRGVRRPRSPNRSQVDSCRHPGACPLLSACGEFRPGCRYLVRRRRPARRVPGRTGGSEVRGVWGPSMKGGGPPI